MCSVLDSTSLTYTWDRILGDTPIIQDMIVFLMYASIYAARFLSG
jgi:hypothetical protein